MTKVIVFASFHPKPGKEADVERILRGMVGPTRKEPGCEVYDLLKTTEGETTFHIFERYKDRAALEAHRAADYFKAYRAAIPEFLAEPIGVKLLEQVE